MITLYNSYTNTKEDFVVKDNKVSLYVCGPTVYNYIHIGNARPVITFDILRRFLEFKNIEVSHTSNFTDIDDKIIKQAILEKTTEEAIARKYIEAFNKDILKLNILKPHHQPLVTKVLQEIINIIKELIDKDYAYIQKETGDVYFDVLKSKKYGTLNNINTDELINNASQRVSQKNSEGLNFVLWKITKAGLTLDSPWGKGRPGWHTECVAMIHNIYGKKGVDIHGGGVDLKFPHHTNEIAHSEAIWNSRLADVWMHNGFVNFESDKMSKSIGNVILLRDALKEWDMRVLKLLFLSTHYQKPIKYSQNELEQLTKVANKITSVISQIDKLNVKKIAKKGKFINQVIKSLSDNLNTSNALSFLYSSIKEFNRLNRIGHHSEKEIAKEVLAILDVLGLR